MMESFFCIEIKLSCCQKCNNCHCGADATALPLCQQSLRFNVMGLFNILGGSSKSDRVQEMLANGAVIIDVRTPQEFSGGHVAGSKNIPLQQLQSRVDELKKVNAPLVLCCASGMRSAQATSFLKERGFECENGGGWMRVNGMVANH